MRPTGDHLYTISSAERDHVLANAGYLDEGTAAWVLAEPVGRALLPLYRLYNPETGDHFYTTSLAERDGALLRHGYRDEGVACDVLPHGDPGGAPLHRLYNPETGDHFYTTSAAERDNSVAVHGYRDEGAACPVYTGPGPGRVPLFRMLKRYGARIRLHAKIVQDWVGEGNVGFVWPRWRGEGVPLWRSYSPATGDHFYTTSDEEHRDAVRNHGYQDEGIACRVPAAPGAGTTPLHRSVHRGKGDHFYTASLAEHQRAVAVFGYTDEGVACHVVAAPGPNLVPLLRMWNSELENHFYTADQVEHDGLLLNPAPDPSLTTQVTTMQRVYDQADIRVEVASFQTISHPAGVDVDVGRCVMGFPTGEQDGLYGNRDFVGENELVIYFVRMTNPPNNGCASHPSGRPGAVVVNGATAFTLGHEVGHVLGLGHVDDNTRLMTGNGTANIARGSTPTLTDDEIEEMDSSDYTVDI